jgi:hypothetical protein
MRVEMKVKPAEETEHHSLKSDALVLATPVTEAVAETQLSEEDRKSLAAEFAEYQKQQLANRNSNYEKADAAILTLSSAFLLGSITFLKDVVSPSKATWLWLVVVSWALFFLSITCVVVSFYTGRKSCEDAEEYAYQHYVLSVPGVIETWNEKIPSIKYTKDLNTAGGVCLLLAILCWVVFASINVLNPLAGASTMSDKPAIKGIPPSTPRPSAPSQPKPTPAPASKPSTK